MRQLSLDLTYALRELRRRPGFTATAVVSLALGIGATSAVFSVIWAILINPFPYVGSDRIMQINLRDKAGNYRGMGMTAEQIQQMLQTKSIESFVAEDGWNLTTTDGDIPEDVQASYVSTNAPNHWGTPALMGRWFVPSDAPMGQEPERVVVLGYRFWQRYYNGDPGVVGRTIQLVRKNYQILGVMPPRFRWREADIYVPLKMVFNPNIYYGGSIKIRPSISVAHANAELQPIVQEFARQTPDRFPDQFQVALRSITDLFAKPLGPMLYVLFGAVASLLLIGCANVSILLLARGTQRQHELAVRAALGAQRGRIVRQLLTEAFVIAAAGAAFGVLLAWRSLALLIAWIPSNSYPAESVIEMNLPVLLFSVALAVATALIFGISPALQLSRPDVGRVMQASARRVMGSARAKLTHRIMVAAQVSLTILMLTVAGIAAKRFLALMNTDLGYDPQQTMSLPIPVHEGTYPTWKERSEYFERLRSRIAAMPRVIGAGISTNATPPSNGGGARFEIEGDSGGEKPEARLNFVSSEYFPVLRIPLAHGRIWDETETRRAAPVVVINQTMARQFWPNGNAIGRKIRIPGLKDEPPYSPAAESSLGWLEVIGVVADARNDGLRNPIKPAFYVPYTIRMRMFTQILVRTEVSPLSMLQEIRQAIVQVDREQQVMRVRDLNEWISNLQEYSQGRLAATLFALYSVLALMLAAAGLYSVVSYGVANKTNEFGIRMALGAKGRDVVRVVLSDTFINVAAGIAGGIVLSFAFDSFMARFLTTDGGQRDPLILAGVILLLLAVAILACLVPARRAASVDPMEALRYE